MNMEERTVPQTALQKEQPTQIWILLWTQKLESRKAIKAEIDELALKIERLQKEQELLELQVKTAALLKKAQSIWKEEYVIFVFIVWPSPPQNAPKPMMPCDLWRHKTWCHKIHEDHHPVIMWHQTAITWHVIGSPDTFYLLHDAAQDVWWCPVWPNDQLHLQHDTKKTNWNYSSTFHVKCYIIIILSLPTPPCHTNLMPASTTMQ